MEALRFIQGISAPLMAVGLDHRQLHLPPPAHLSTVAPPDATSMANEKSRRGSWVMKILRVGSLWTERRKEDPVDEEKEEEVRDDGDRCAWCGGEDGVEGCSVEEKEERDRVEFDGESFSRFLRSVSLSEAKFYAKMSYLGKLSYNIPDIEPVRLLKYHGLHYVTSSLEKKAILSKLEGSTPNQVKTLAEPTTKNEENKIDGEKGGGISASAAYGIVASAATYLQSQTKNILPQRTVKSEVGDDPSISGSSNEDEAAVTSSQMDSFVATTNSVTSVISGEEEMKDAVAENLNSVCSSPCEWFICDDDKSRTRYFVIQGSESLAAWQANLLFEPVQFEGLDVLVHRGIYEAAKGIYQQMLAEVQAHQKCQGNNAFFRFTGHSLGGSLAVLVNLMLLIRGDAPPSSLLPVVTFGAPSIMCGGDYLLHKLGMPRTHVQAITLHRDIVPRAFSCHYPDQVAKILKAVNRNFRNHPCLKYQSLLYAPMGKLLILQPEEKFSPHHHLLPSGSGLYLMDLSSAETKESMKLLQSAQYAFLNSPHPLETLSDRSAYGSEGTIFRDHDVNSYLRSIRMVIEKELKHIRKAKRRVHRRVLWWPFVSAQGVQSAFVISLNIHPLNVVKHQVSFVGMLNGGKEILNWFTRMVSSQFVHIFVLFLVPFKLLFLGTLSLVNFR
ncbi:uncharacterized protein LOC110031027 [Phalaenopsis equestris]|uniref:uncharacterized protein LOC110031027 n=1 Tax=Phalaenopsis equestris TaxID=78828 RepID=UPI0009E42FBB|nr:uncharacterized protein LOC110031027 [Phalaenopsis equestris]